MLEHLSYKYYHKQGSKTVFLILHGGGPEGVETTFISGIISRLSDNKDSVFGFNFPYCERGEEDSSGPELTEEIAALKDVITFLRSEGYTKISIIGKSLGAIVASFWLSQTEANDVEVSILGYVIGDVKTEALKGKVRVVIQGENDRFGNADAVKKELAQHGVAAKVVEMQNADHSYRNEKKEPVYQAKVIELLVQDTLSS